MSDDAEVLPLPERPPVPDGAEPPRPRAPREILKEAALVLPHLLVLLYRLARDPRVPRRAKIVAGAVAAYVASPIDLIPDGIPIVGQIDDLLLVAVALDQLLRSTSEEVVAEHWPGSEDAYDIVHGLVAWLAELVPDSVARLLRW